MQNLTHLQLQELSFRKGVKEVAVGFRRDVFVGLKSTPSAKLYTKNVFIDHDAFRLLTLKFRHLKTTVKPLDPVIKQSTPPRKLLKRAFLRDTSGKPLQYIDCGFNPFASCPKSLLTKKKKKKRKRRTESKPVKYSSNPCQWKENKITQFGLFRVPGKKVTKEVAMLDLTDQYFEAFLEFEASTEWNARGKSETCAGFLNAKIINQHTILLVYEITLVYNDSNGVKKCQVKFKTAKLNSAQVLELPPNTTEEEWKRVSDATDSSEGESIIERARAAGIQISDGFPSKFFCRHPGPERHNPFRLPGPYQCPRFTPGVTIGHCRRRRDRNDTRLALRAWQRGTRKRNPLQFNRNLGHGGQRRARHRGPARNEEGACATTVSSNTNSTESQQQQSTPSRLPAGSAAANFVPHASCPGQSQYSGEPDSDSD